MSAQQANGQHANAAPQSKTIANAGEAAQAIETLSAIMDRLIGTVEDETEHMRAGRLHDALALEETKAELARSYAVESGRLKAAERLVVRAPAHHHGKIRRLLSFSRKWPNLDVMDPYYGGPQGFEENLDMIEDAVQGLIREITGASQVRTRSGS